MYLKKISNSDLLILITQIKILLEQNINIDKALIHLEQNNLNKSIFISKLVNLIREGNSVSLSFTKLKEYSTFFDDFFIQVIVSGEKSASLLESFTILEEYLKSKNKIISEIKNSCIYPTIILITIVVFIAFLFQYMLPNFEHFYLSLNNEIPENTKNLIKLKNYFINNILSNLHFFILITYLLFINKKLIKQSIPTKIKKKLYKSFIKIFNNIPIFSKLYYLIISYKFLFILYTCIKYRLSIIESLDTFISKQNNINYQISNFIESLKSGCSLKKSIELCAFIPDDIRQLLFIEQKNQSSSSDLLVAINLIKHQINQKVTFLSKVLEPTLTLILTIIIVLVIYLLYLPFLNIEIS